MMSNVAQKFNVSKYYALFVHVVAVLEPTMPCNRRLFIAFGIFAVWLAIYLIVGRLAHGALSKGTSVTQVLGEHVVANIAVAACFMLVVAVASRSAWPDFGLAMPVNVLWTCLFPYSYLLLPLLVALFAAKGSVGVAAVMFFNTVLVATSEEFMFRGVLYRALRASTSYWLANIISCVLFGSVHLMNAIGTGDVIAAALQGTAAVASGFSLLAMTVRTTSLLPSVLWHCLWDFFLLFASTGVPMMSPQSPSTMMQTAPKASPIVLLLVSPLLVYGIVMLRKGDPREDDDEERGATESSTADVTFV